VTALVDTPVIVDLLRNDHRAVRLLTDLLDGVEGVWAATPTRTEVIAGIRTSEREAMQQLFAVFSWVEVDAAIADAAGEFARRYRRSHSGIDTIDYLIAAAAQSIGAHLVTLNVRHYPMFEGLKPAYR
jgi:predicted nucleic acid-binding protein